MAFALVELENVANWEWFMHLVKVEVIGSDCEVFAISDWHVDIMIVVVKEITGYPLLHHHWCMCHFAANFFSANATKNETKDLRRLCMENEPIIFEEV